jgi:hypothetical protein
MLQAILNLLRGYTLSFTDYERAVLEAVARELSGPLRARLARRIAAIKKVQRHDGGREVLAYQKMKGTIVFPDETRLTDENGSVMLASFAVRARSPMSALGGKVWVYNGNLASIDFNKPTEHAEVADIERIDVKVGKAFRPIE